MNEYTAEIIQFLHSIVALIMLFVYVGSVFLIPIATKNLIPPVLGLLSATLLLTYYSLYVDHSTFETLQSDFCGMGSYIFLLFGWITLLFSIFMPASGVGPFHIMVVLVVAWLLIGIKTFARRAL